MDPIVQTFRDLLRKATETMQKADLTPFNLTAENPPFVGGDFDVVDGWQTVVYPLKNQHGVNVELKLGFEIRHDKTIIVKSSASAWYQSAPYGEFPVHSGSIRKTEEPLYHHQLGENGLSDLFNEAMTIATLIEPEDVASESWSHVVISNPEDGEGKDASLPANFTE